MNERGGGGGSGGGEEKGTDQRQLRLTLIVRQLTVYVILLATWLQGGEAQFMESASIAANNCSIVRPIIDPSPADDFTRLVETDSSDLGNRTPLILIHGVHGNRPSQDSSVDDVCQPNSAYWVSLVGFLGNSTSANVLYKVYSFHYVSDRFSVDEIARALRNDVDQAIADDTRFDKRLVLIAHSMGGLVARNYMNHHRHQTGQWKNELAGERVQKLITLGTPHHGSPLAGTESVDQIADARWQITLALASLWSWKGEQFPIAYIAASEPNRKDLLWDNFDSRFKSGNSDLNGALVQLNREERYGSKIVAYYGYLSQGDAARQTLIQGLGITESTPGLLAVGLYDYIKDKHMLLLGASIAMDLGLKRFYADNDGLVPRSSSSFSGSEILKRVECTGYDHLDMLDNSSRKCADNQTLFQSLAGELGITRPVPAIISAVGLTNAASFKGGAVAPGEILVLFGTNMASSGIRAMQVGVDGRAATWLGGTSVLFDGVASPLVYVSPGQISAIVPYAAFGKGSMQVAVDYHGVRSNTITMQINPSSPGIFTADSSGSGQAAALNQDGTLNSSARPLEAGQIVVLYATGEGQTTPAGQDGLLAQSSYPRPLLPVTVRIGGLPSEVLYAAAAPGLVAGIMQINARVPSEVTSGAIPIIVSVGNSTSQSGVTIAVRNSRSIGPDQLGVTGTWDFSWYYALGRFRSVSRIFLRQSGTSLSGDIQDIFANYTARRGAGPWSGTNVGGLITFSFRGSTPDSDVANVTNDGTGSVSNDGGSLSGTEVAYYDTGGSRTAVWNATRRRLRSSTFTIDGMIRHSGEQVHAAVWIPRGARVTAEVFAERNKSPLDAVLDSLKTDAETVVASDDDTVGKDPKIVFTANQSPSNSQLYYFRVSGYGESTGAFLLAVSLQATGAQSLPVQAQVSSIPLSAVGLIGLRDEVDIYSVDLPEGSTFVAEVAAYRAGSPLDPVLTVLGPDGTTELGVNDDTLGLSTDSRVTFTTRLAGKHFLAVQSKDGAQFGPSYTYTLTTQRIQDSNLSSVQSDIVPSERGSAIAPPLPGL